VKNRPNFNHDYFIVKILLKIGLITLLLAAVSYSVLYFTRVRKNQSKEISLEFASRRTFIKDNLQDLPLLRFESKKSTADYFIILFPGDGGWRDFIDYLSNYISGNGINVVGFNTIPYFNHTRTPHEVAHDIQRVITNFSDAWGKNKVILAGYSFGAEILPFVYNELGPGFKNKVVCLALIAPSNLADFKVSPIYYYNPSGSLPVLPEIKKVKTTRTLIFCDKQKNSICRFVNSNDSIDLAHLGFGHLFTGKFKEASVIITSSIIKESEKK
jgi:type IV secretory pathway VirJ component